MTLDQILREIRRWWIRRLDEKRLSSIKGWKDLREKEREALRRGNMQMVGKVRKERRALIERELRGV